MEAKRTVIKTSRKTAIWVYMISIGVGLFSGFWLYSLQFKKFGTLVFAIVLFLGALYFFFKSLPSIFISTVALVINTEGVQTRKGERRVRWEEVDSFFIRDGNVLVAMLRQGGIRSFTVSYFADVREAIEPLSHCAVLDVRL